LIVVDTREARSIPLISIITATYNAGKHLPKLIESIKAQTDRDFEWVVADGASTDDTLELLRQVEGVSMVVDSRPDCGIYDAFNRGIGIAKGKYYLVVGADDRLFADAVAKYRAEVVRFGEPDLVIGSVQFGESVRPAFWRPQNGWLGGHAVVTAHSVGMLIRKDIHSMCGLYSRRFGISADALFVKSLLPLNPRVCVCDSVVGMFSLNGASNSNVAQSLCENFLIQLRTEDNVLMQVWLFVMRLMKNFARLRGS